MNDKLNFKAEFSNKSSTIKTELILISFEEDNVFFVYCPALDLTGYGHNKTEAKKSFSQTLKMYFDYTSDKKTLSKDLELHGWSVKNNNNLKAPDFDYLFKNNKHLKSIVNSRDFSKYKKQVQIPDCVYA